MQLTGIERESFERLLKTVASGVFVYRRPSERERRQMRDVRSGTLERDALRQLMDDPAADIMLRLAAGKALVREPRKSGRCDGARITRHGEDVLGNRGRRSLT